MLNLIPLHTFKENGPYLSEIVDITFLGDTAPQKIISCIIGRQSTFMTDMNIHIRHKYPYKTIKNFYRLYSEIRLEIGGQTIVTIPTSYIALILKVINEIDINSFSDKFNTIIPIKLKELCGIPFILLPWFHECRLTLYPNPISIFEYPIKRLIPLNTSWPPYESFINVLPKDIWKIILNYMDNVSWLNIRLTSKFFYSIVTDLDIESRYNKCKIKLEDLEFLSCDLKVMYSQIGKITKEALTKQLFINECRSLEEKSKYIVDEDNVVIYSFGDQRLTEFVIIDIDYWEKDILHSIEYEQVEWNVPQHQVELVDEKEVSVSVLCKDPEFYEKMHQKEKNRYMYYFTGCLRSLVIRFKKKITGKVTVFTARKKQVRFEDTLVKVF
ncbi:MAG: hypothetical protein Barrevirus13_14 [Barrevirus sp.]|uniref:F-box domain-containing protein n=1 Tax=Barrevirus sp. TaxID=2487763 RepID=A0A3G4ZQG7_9VIRU|nr:MAG: hypothetical protein Barrevirus13_14 [Barrevirus sp.]